MELSELKKELQGHFSDGLVLVIGSGLSCAEGVPGMGALADHLISHIPSILSVDDEVLWNDIEPLIKADGLEAALLKKAPTPLLESAIVHSTASFVADSETAIILEVLNKKKTLRLSKLIPHLNKPEGGIHIVTTNYDRLVELACEEAGLGVDTMFCGHFTAKLDPTNAFWSFCRGVKHRTGKYIRHHFAAKANVYKPHGSLDWYHRDGSPVRYAGALPLPRLIITPGLNKFRNGYESPFDKHRERANDAIDKARRFLIIGYGFNDDHLETHLTPRIRSGARSIMMTYKLSPKAQEIAERNNNVIAIEHSEVGGVDGSSVIINGSKHFYPKSKYWDLEDFVTGVLTA